MPKNPNTDSPDPLLFTGASEDMAQSARSATRSTMLQSGFMVSTYKNYGSPGFIATDHTVMDKYLVEYKERRDDWNGVVESNWNYIGVNGQIEKYWDYSNFPYRFHAVAPKQPTMLFSPPTGMVLNDSHLKIPAVYKAQKFEATPSPSAVTTVTPSDEEAEPYLVAQVNRDPNGYDSDILVNKGINNTSTTKSRRVALPFHHLNSKVRFAVYTDNLAQTDKDSYVKDMTIWVEKLATQATGFEAHGTESWSSQTGFSNFTGITVNDAVTIFKYNCFASGETAQRSYTDNNMSLHQSRSSAYFLECPNGIMQLPQDNLKIHVSLAIAHDSESKYFYDYEIQKPAPGSIPSGSTETDPTHWLAGHIHTYYLHLQFSDDHLPIMTVTCTLSDWTDISGSLSTDLEQ